jgi:hypothetical protein
VEAMGEREGCRRVRGAWDIDGGVHGQRGGQGWGYVHVLQAGKDGLACVTVGAEVEGQERVSSSLPAALSTDLMGGMPPQI